MRAVIDITPVRPVWLITGCSTGFGREFARQLLAGVRGAVTLAGVLTLPVLLADGSPFPARDLAIVLADDGVDPQRSAAAAARVVARYRQRIARPGGDIAARRRGESEDIERRLQLVGLRAERDEIQRLARSGEIEELVRRRLVRDLDLQEARYGG